MSIVSVGPKRHRGLCIRYNATNNATYKTNFDNSMIHAINGAASNIKIHSTFISNESRLQMTVALDLTRFGFSTLNVYMR
jgi:hypothetical protein